MSYILLSFGIQQAVCLSKAIMSLSIVMKFSILRRPAGWGVGIAGLLVSACSYTKGREDMPAPCNIVAASVTYEASIKPIITANCLACHSSVSKAAGGNHNWENVSELHEYAVSGSLLNSVERKNVPEKLYMPLGGPKLSACDIETIRAWVAKGAPEK